MSNSSSQRGCPSDTRFTIQNMIVNGFERSLGLLRDSTVEVTSSGAFPESGAASVRLRFSDGSMPRTDYWRIVKSGKAGISSFDHEQKYGLPQPIDALFQLGQELKDKLVADARLDSKTGDLLFEFEGNIEFQVFNFTGYEVWEIRFANGTGEYSNYARPYAPD